MVIRRKKVSFKATKIIKKLVIVKFRRADGSVAKFKATKAIRVPTNVTFYAKRKKRR